MKHTEQCSKERNVIYNCMVKWYTLCTEELFPVIHTKKYLFLSYAVMLGEVLLNFSIYNTNVAMKYTEHCIRYVMCFTTEYMIYNLYGGIVSRQIYDKIPLCVICSNVGRHSINFFNERYFVVCMTRNYISLSYSIALGSLLNFSMHKTNLGMKQTEQCPKECTVFYNILHDIQLIRRALLHAI